MGTRGGRYWGPDAYTFIRESAADRREHWPIYRIPLITFYGIAFAGVNRGLDRKPRPGMSGQVWGIDIAEESPVGKVCGGLPVRAQVGS